MSECHSVWLSEIIHISLKNHITILNLPRRGGRRITAKEAEQRKPLFRFKSLNSWKKQRTLNYPPFPPTVKPEALTRLLVGRKAPPWHDLLDLAECSPVEQRGGAERETRTPDLRQACVKSKPLQRGDPRWGKTLNLHSKYTFFFYICKDKYLLKMMQTHATLTL